MKINEVFEGLIKNRKNIYQAKYGGFRCELSVEGMGFFYLKIFDNNGNLIDSRLPGGGLNGNIEYGLEWELVPKEVSWQEAIQAWVDGKGFYVEVGNDKYIQTSNEMLGHFNTGTGFFTMMFSYGKWFVV